MAEGIKSKDRVKDFGEVFTPDKIVNDMLDLVDKEFTDLTPEEYISKVYLEPACGDGQFLIRILYRKLQKVLELPEVDRELGLVKALTSIYGVDIQEDNVVEARARMLAIALGKTVASFDLDNKTNEVSVDLGITIKPQMKKVISSILEHNIIVGDTLKEGNESLELFCYHFEGDKLSVAKCQLSDTTNEHDETGKRKYTQILYQRLTQISKASQNKSRALGRA